MSGSGRSSNNVISYSLNFDSLSQYELCHATAVQGTQQSDDCKPSVSGQRLAIQVPGETRRLVSTRFVWVNQEACSNSGIGIFHEMGVFVVDDKYGRVENLLPGDENYAIAALSSMRRHRVFAYGQTAGAVIELGLRSRQYVGLYLIQDGTVEDFEQQNPRNQLGQEPLVFFSFPKANPDGIDHLLEHSPNTLGWEDLSGGGDWDFNDLVFQFEFTTPVTEPDVSLQEESLFQASHRQTLQIPQTSSILSFTYTCLNFDSTDPDLIKDAFEVALVDENGNSLVEPFAANRDAFFNITEGQLAAIGSGVSLEGQTVQVNLARVEPGSTATLIFRLVNNDRDTDTNVHIEEIQFRVGDGTFPPEAPPAEHVPASNQPIDFTQLADVSGSLIAQYGRTSFNDRTHCLYADLAIYNAGQYRVDAPLLVAIANLSHPTVQVVEADGVTPDGLPYYDFSTALDKPLLPGKTSGSRPLAFFNPQGIQFTYNLIFLGQINQAPKFISQPSLEALVGHPYLYQASAMDPNHDPLTYNIVTGPIDLAVHRETGEVRWFPTARQIGNHAITLKVEDGRGGFALQTYTLTVMDHIPNRPPQFTSTPVVDAAVNRPYRYDVQAVDPDRDALEFTLLNAPSGMVLEPETGKITWTPTAKHVGQQAIAIQISDGQGGTATQMFNVFVQPEPGNHPPVIISQPIRQFALPNHQPGAPIVLDAIVRDFNDTHPNFEGTGPWGHTPGMVSRQLGLDQKPTLRNGFGSITPEQFSQWYNDMPGINLATTTSLTLTETTPGSGIYRFFSDRYFPLDGTLFGNQGRNHNYHFTTEIHAIFTYRGGEFFNFTGDDDVWVFINNQLVVDLGGVHPAISASVNLDSLGLTVGKSYTIDIFHAERHTVESNFQLETSLQLESTKSSGEYLYPVRAIDPDQDVLTYALITAPVAMQINSSTGQIAWKATTQDLGQHPVKIQVEDGRGGIAIQDFVLEVTHLPLPETPDVLAHALDEDNFSEITELKFVSVPPTQVQMGELLHYQAKAVHPEMDLLTYDLSVKPVGMGIEPDTGVIVWQPTMDQVNQSFEVRVQVRDRQNQLALQSCQIQVTPANTPPTITSIPPRQAVVGVPYQYFVQAQDAEGDHLSFRLNQAPSGMIIHEQTGVLTFTPSASQLGNQTIRLTVSDGKGGEAIQTFAIAIVATVASTPLAITSTPRQTIGLGQSYFYQVKVTGADSDAIAFTLAQAPPGMTIDAMGFVTWQPTAHHFGANPVKVQVTDGRGKITTQPFVLTVVSQTRNHPPKITAHPPQGATVGQEYQYNLTGEDPDGDPLVWNLVTAPLGMSLNPLLGTVRWIPTAEQVGFHTIQIEALDRQGGKAIQSISLTVRGVNTPPTITSIPPTQAAVQQAYEYVVMATDIDRNSLTFALLSAPTGMVIHPQSGALRWIPTASQMGVHLVGIQVTDAQGGVAIQEYRLSVVATVLKRAPVITSIPRVVAKVRSPYIYPVTAVDPDGGSLKISLENPPPGMIINSKTGLIHWRPTIDQVGMSPITIIVTNKAGAIATQTFALVVSPNRAPKIISQPPETAIAHAAYRYDIQAIDPDEDLLTYTLMTAPEGMTLDSLGRLQWIPNISDIGIHLVQVMVADDLEARVIQSYKLTVLADQEAPKVHVSLSQSQVTIGSMVTVTVTATDNVGVKDLHLSIDDTPVGLDAKGQTMVKATKTGNVQIVATAVDAAGNVGRATAELSVVNVSEADMSDRLIRPLAAPKT